MVHRPVRDLRRGSRRSTWPCAGRNLAQDSLGNHRPSTPPGRHPGNRRLIGAVPWRRDRRGGGRDDRRRRRRHRGHRFRQRGGDHRRVRARPQGTGHGHPQLRHGRHHPDERSARDLRDHEPRGNLPRPNDRPRRGRQATAHAQRDRPGDPAFGPDDHLPDGHGHPPAVRAVRRDDGGHGGARRAPGLPDPYDDRRPAFIHRHRRHGPGRPVQRPGDERPGRGSGRRRGRDPARQDRHDHLRQSPGRVDYGGSRRCRG